jgi:hypothetical protein
LTSPATCIIKFRPTLYGIYIASHGAHAASYGIHVAS